jgi:hypothetical protein
MIYTAICQKVWHQAGNKWSREPRFPHGPRDRLAAGRTALDEKKSVDMFYNVEHGGGSKSGMATVAMRNLRGTSCKTRADRFPPKGKSLAGQTSSSVGPGTYANEDMRSWNRNAGASQHQFNSKVERQLQDGRKDLGTVVEPTVKLAPGQAPPIEVRALVVITSTREAESCFSFLWFSFFFQVGGSIDSGINEPYSTIPTASSTIRPSYNYSFDKLPRKTWVDIAQEKATPRKRQEGPDFFHFLQGQPVHFSANDD